MSTQIIKLYNNTYQKNRLCCRVHKDIILPLYNHKKWNNQHVTEMQTFDIWLATARPRTLDSLCIQI